MYKIKISKALFLKEADELIYFDLKINDNYVTYKSKYLPTNENYEIIQDYNNLFFTYIKRKIGLFLGIIIFTCAIIANSVLIKDIIFLQDVDDDIYDYLSSNVSKGVLSKPILEINHEMKKIFTEYEWVSVDKIGNTLIVETKEAPSYKKVELNNKIGDFYASKRGVIKYFQVDKGLPLIEYNTFVEQDQLLVSGNLNHLNGQEENLVAPRGIIIAETFSIEEFSVPKRVEKEYLTGKIYNDKYINIFSRSYSSETVKYSLYEKRILKTINFFNIFSYQEVKYLEKNVIISEYNRKSAYEFALDQINFDELFKYKHEKEDIIEILLLTEKDDINDFTFKFLVKRHENITKFIKR